MVREQRFIVSWTVNDGEERYATFETLERALLRYENLRARDYEQYVYLSVVIDQD